jgi:hypothetical protein
LTDARSGWHCFCLLTKVLIHDTCIQDATKRIFLLGEDASHITGAVIDVDGGLL